MNAIVDGKVFKSGNSAAVRLPREVTFALGTEVSIERRGSEIVIRPKSDPDSIRAGLRAMFAEIDAAWEQAPFHEIETRQQPIAPDRNGLH